MLKEPVTLIKGIGEASADQLATLDIYSIEDLLFYFPYRYDDYRQRNLDEVAHQETVSVVGEVISEPLIRWYGPKRSRLTFKMRVDQHLLTAVIFNRPYVKNKLKPGQFLLIGGKLDKQRWQINVSTYRLHFDHSDPKAVQETLLPVYPVAGTVKVAQMRNWVRSALRTVKEIPEVLPDKLLKEYRLLSRTEALHKMHFPRDAIEGRQARRRFVYEEFLIFQLKMSALRKRHREQIKGNAQVIDHERLERFIHTLPFRLTEAQERVLSEIVTDLKADYAMNRLLQGDVGSGKTVVAAGSIVASASAGYQAALMVPTEILAEQHYRTLKHLFTQETINIALLTGSTLQRKRNEILAGLRQGFIDVVVGTHALIQEDVQFNKLGLMITDEQHRFGVKQRRMLRYKGKTPDVLLMTATPIPRTLAITAFGDLDVSILDQLPAGRKKVKTYWLKEERLPDLFQFLQKEIEQGGQAYIVCPLIEESDKLDVQNVLDIYHQIKEAYSTWRIGLLHGRLSTVEKDEVMARFSRGELDVLVSTTVVEVGVNVPQATVMAIYDAERFGLAQLHQLRGRVGRGKRQSYCFLIADPKTEVGRERMRVMCSTNDGFEVARRDLLLRGPGDFFGTQQSGLPQFKVADLMHDGKALEVARKDAQRLSGSRSYWEKEEYAPLREEVRRQLDTEDKLLD